MNIYLLLAQHIRNIKRTRSRLILVYTWIHVQFLSDNITQVRIIVMYMSPKVRAKIRPLNTGYELYHYVYQILVFSDFYCKIVI